MLRRCLVAATQLRHCRHLIHHCPVQLSHVSRGTTGQLQAACSIQSVLLRTVHGSSVWSGSWQQHQDATPQAAPHCAEASEDAVTEGDEGISNGQIFDNGTGEKVYIAPATTDSLIFNGIPYNQLPIVHIKATYNNTHVSVADHRGITVTRTSCGTEGFKNAKKGTAIAAQTAAIAAATKALDKGMNTVRVVIKGIGPGRQTSIKGLQMGGLDIVSITDNTPVPHNGCRPRKARR